MGSSKIAYQRHFMFFAHHFAPFHFKTVTCYEKHYGKSTWLHRIHHFLQNLHNEIYIQIFSCTWNTVLTKCISNNHKNIYIYKSNADLVL